MKLNHPLMHNNFSNSDMNAVRKLINGEELNNKEAIANPESLDFFKNLTQLKI